MCCKFLGAVKHGAAAMIAVSTLVACGGGGDSGAASTTVDTTTFPLSIAIANYVNETMSSRFNMTGIALSSGQSISFSGNGMLSESNAPGTFEGSPALKKSATITGSIILLGNTVPVAGTSVSFFDTNYNPLGNVTDNAYCVASSKIPMPAIAHIGDNGNWFTSTCYRDSSKAMPIGSGSYSYALEPEGGTTAFLKLIASTTDGAGNKGSPIVQTFRITTSGNLTRIEESGMLNVGGVVLSYVAKYQ